jgi:hypothetical protein
MTGCYKTINMGAEGEGGIVKSFSHYNIIDISLYSKNRVCQIINTIAGKPNFITFCTNVVENSLQLALRFSGRN